MLREAIWESMRGEPPGEEERGHSTEDGKERTPKAGRGDAGGYGAAAQECGGAPGSSVR